MMLNIFNDIGTFFKNVNWGLVGILTAVAIVVGLVLILIFKNNKVVSIFSLILVLITGITTIVLTYKANMNSYGEWRDNVTIDTQIKDVDNTAKDKYTNTNGGFTIPQIEDSKKQLNCPTADDQILDFGMYDFGDWVVFETLENNLYENLLFLKTDKGLIADGVSYKVGSYTKKTDNFLWWYSLDIDSWMWDSYTNLNSDFSSVRDYFNAITGFNLEDFMTPRISKEYELLYRKQFDTYYGVDSACKNRNSAYNIALQRVAKLTGETIADFSNFEEIELISTKELVTSYVNSLFTYLYEQSKDVLNCTSKYVDITDLMCLPIPLNLRQNYPVSAEFKEKYPDVDYYGVYNCDIVAKVYKIEGTQYHLDNGIKDNYEEHYFKDDNHKITEYEPVREITLINLNLVDIKNSDFTNFDLNKNHAYITIFDENKNAVKTINLNSKQALNNTYQLLLNSNTTYTYEIFSGPLIFNNIQGSFKTSEAEERLKIEYYYLNNYMAQSVGLNPIGTIDTTKLDLVNNPVKIILNGKTNNETYQFVFNSNADFEKYKTMMVQMGDYTFAILSKQLIFNEVSGELTISSETPIILFNCTLQNISSDLTFTINLETYSNNKDLSLYSDASNVTLIREKLSSQKVYNVITTIYDDDGYIIEKLTHQHAVTGTCSDSWNFTNMIDGEHYTLQLSFVDAYDSTKTYLSDIFEFTYDSTKNYRVIYNVTKNA